MHVVLFSIDVHRGNETGLIRPKTISEEEEKNTHKKEVPIFNHFFVLI